MAAVAVIAITVMMIITARVLGILIIGRRITTTTTKVVLRVLRNNAMVLGIVS